MDRTFGQPRKSPVPPALLVAVAYGLGLGLFFVRQSVSCAGLTIETMAGLCLCLGVLVLTGLIGVFAKHRLIWMAPLLLWVALQLLSISGVATSYVGVEGHSGCGVV
ncbi:hypothetical protein [Asticcacaulis sp. AC460]|uniref:hypothetical protein n=1 Tax=Asticcacaulis sp. AC460 TaxID=1282360 RepID=UPI0004012A9B|nr:hypothetical protein [Asticcacaulis sp. AC460]